MAEYVSKAVLKSLVPKELWDAIDSLKNANVVPIPETGIGDLSDGYHTFNQLYFQRCILFAQIVNDHPNRAWKTRCHEDGQPCFGGGWFLVTIDTPSGAYGYHFEDKHWDLFDCEELPKAKHWDGYTEKDVMRLFTLPDVREKKEEG